MAFKRLLGSLGVGGPLVDTVLTGGPVRPGGALRGEVRLAGGGTVFRVEHVTLELAARVEHEHAQGEDVGVLTFARVTLAGGFRLGAGERLALPFDVTLPWETPLTELNGRRLGIVLGVRTELAVAGARDAGDLDALAVTALPAQEAVLGALGRLGFAFHSADLERGVIRNTRQSLPFYQEIELRPAPRYARAMRELEVTFLAGPKDLHVVLEADKGRPGGGDVLSLHTVPHDDAGRDWSADADAWIRALLSTRR
ncbi:sporulation protein [Streptomyces sp. JJ66]|nr:sporulation protein [Streptomyces sp. JJ66]